MAELIEQENHVLNDKKEDKLKAFLYPDGQMVPWVEKVMVLWKHQLKRMCNLQCVKVTEEDLSNNFKIFLVAASVCENIRLGIPNTDNPLTKVFSNDPEGIYVHHKEE
jgi:hypothetical protein